MIEKIMNKLGYYKVGGDILNYNTLGALLNMNQFPVSTDEYRQINMLKIAKYSKKDLFIDYVKKTGTQKFYLNKKLVLEI